METTTLNNGVTVLGKYYKGEITARSYVNRTQAQKMVDKLGAGWAVYHFGRPFYVGKAWSHK